MAFFKSTWFKCTTVLLAIALIAGGLLAVLNDVLFVTAEERTARAMTKIYGEAKEILPENVIFDIDDTDDKTPLTNEYGNVNKIYIIGDKTADTFDMVYQAQGKEGYKGGTITLWLKVIVTNGDFANAKLDKVVLESYDKQTLMGKFDAMYYGEFVEKYQAGELFTANGKKNPDKIQNVITGATKSSNASCNAVNCVITHLQNFTLGGNA